MGQEIFVEILQKLTKCQQRYGAEKINGLPQRIAGKAQKLAYSKKSGGGTDDSFGPFVCYSEDKTS